jgi:hypothetical protein
MKPIYRKEIHAFILASETILSRVILVPPMTAEREAPGSDVCQSVAGAM